MGKEKWKMEKQRDVRVKEITHTSLLLVCRANIKLYDSFSKNKISLQKTKEPGYISLSNHLPL